MLKKNARTPVKFAIFLLTFFAIGFFKISPILIVISAAILGIGLGRLAKDA